VKLGLKIRSHQTISRLSLSMGGVDLDFQAESDPFPIEIDGNDLIPRQADSYVQGLLVGTFGGTKDEWKGFRIPKDWLGGSTSFKTNFVLDGFTLMGPAFQVVPLVFPLYDTGSFASGHYVVGASVLPGKLDDDPGDPSPLRDGKGRQKKRR
jgi:hypothetical protein